MLHPVLQLCDEWFHVELESKTEEVFAHVPAEKRVRGVEVAEQWITRNEEQGSAGASDVSIAWNEVPSKIESQSPVRRVRKRVHDHPELVNDHLLLIVV